ncbi:MAG: SprT family zinc-dependent metalloprotease [Elusimicrobiota bacterium]
MERTKELVNGESFPLFGRNYRLQLMPSTDAKQDGCATQNGRLVINANAKIRENIENWYCRELEIKIREIISRYSAILKVIPGDLRISKRGHSWGSCSKNGNLSFNWRLAMAPVSVIEYAVVHELCHLKTPDHSKCYWSLLKSVLPDYERQRSWLREKGEGLFWLFN